MTHDFTRIQYTTDSTITFKHWFRSSCIDAQKCYNDLTMTCKVKRYKLIKLASMRFSAEDNSNINKYK